MTLGHSRHGYEEAVWDQKLETFLRLDERAFAISAACRRSSAAIMCLDTKSLLCARV
jgi:hypothetical protein